MLPENVHSQTNVLFSCAAEKDIQLQKTEEASLEKNSQTFLASTEFSFGASLGAGLQGCMCVLVSGFLICPRKGDKRDIESFDHPFRSPHYLQAHPHGRIRSLM